MTERNQEPERRFREAADRVMSLNLEGLDVEGLEQRLTLLEHLGALGEGEAQMMRPRECDGFYCHTFI
jgi:hypothetical protein